MYVSRLSAAFAGAFVFVSFRVSADVPDQSLVDSSVGKPVYYAMAMDAAGDFSNFWTRTYLASGEMPWVISQTPPRSQGLPLQYDSRHLFYIYTDAHAPQNHFIPSGWMGDYGDLHVDEASTDDPADGKTCVKITYNAKGAQGAGWAGMYWQQPVNNWGNKFGGYDLSGVKRLTFWVRGAHGGEVISEFKVGGISGKFEDSGSARIGPVVLTAQWQQLSIDLTQANLQRVMGGFAWSASRFDNRNGMTFYLDEIRFER